MSTYKLWNMVTGESKYLEEDEDFDHAAQCDETYDCIKISPRDAVIRLMKNDGEVVYREEHRMQ